MAVSFSFGCEDSGNNNQAPQITPDSNTLLGYVSLVDGKMGVVDLDRMDTLFVFKPATRGVQETAIVDDQKNLYTGDPTQDEIIHYQINDKYDGVEEVKRFESPVYINALASDRRPGVKDKKFVVTSRVPFLWELVVPTTDKPDNQIAVYDMEAGDWQGTVELPSPGRAVVRDNFAYVANVHHKSVSAVNLDTLEVTRTENVGPATWPTMDGKAVGPKLVEVSHDGRWLATADYEGLSITLFDLENDWAKQVVPVPAVVRSVTFSPDDSQLWAVSYALHEDVYAACSQSDEGCATMGSWYDGPTPANETANAYRKTTIHAFDFATMQLQREFVSEWAGQEVTFRPDGTEFYLSTSAGSVLSYDPETLAMTGEALVGGVGFPILCGGLIF
jgi:WD40 repeat protein